jgi:hypothetical protein
MPRPTRRKSPLARKSAPLSPRARHAMALREAAHHGGGRAAAMPRRQPASTRGGGFRG